MQYPTYTLSERLAATKAILVSFLDLQPVGPVARFTLQAAKGIKDEDSLAILFESLLTNPALAGGTALAEAAARALEKLTNREAQLTAGLNILRALMQDPEIGGRVSQVLGLCHRLSARSSQLRVIQAVLREPSVRGIAYCRWAARLLEGFPRQTFGHAQDVAVAANELLLWMNEDPDLRGAAQVGRWVLACFSDAPTRAAVASTFLRQAGSMLTDRVLRSLDAGVFGSFVPQAGTDLLRHLGVARNVRVHSCAELRQTVLRGTRAAALCA